MCGGVCVVALFGQGESQSIVKCPGTTPRGTQTTGQMYGWYAVGTRVSQGSPRACMMVLLCVACSVG